MGERIQLGPNPYEQEPLSNEFRKPLPHIKEILSLNDCAFGISARNKDSQIIHEHRDSSRWTKKFLYLTTSQGPIECKGFKDVDAYCRFGIPKVPKVVKPVIPSRLPRNLY